jgi:hypothetical protein
MLEVITIPGFKLCFMSHSNSNNMVLAQNRHIDQWNRIDGPEISPHSYTKLIFDKGAKNIHWRKRQPLQQIMLGKLDIHM